MNHLDLFSGIGGFSLGLKRVFDIKHTYYSEIDKYAIDVYKNNFKNITYVKSVTDVRGGQLPKIDIITFGSPCQDFSLAGKRKGMGGAKSSLITEAIRLIEECKPSFFIWENVKGTFSTNNGADFWAIIQAFANIGGYRLEWQLLNTKWFLPQNRERIYLVGYIAKGSRRQIFPIEKNNKQTNELQKQQGNTCTITTRYRASESSGSYIIKRKLNTQEIDSNGYEVGTLRTHNDGKGFRKIKDGDFPTIPARDREDGSGQPIVKINSATTKGYEIATKGDSINYSVPTSKTRRGRVGKGVAQTLDTGCHQAVIKSTKIRRLTPIECERLQGFPDDWTKEGTDGKISDSQRYKMCGNAVTVDVVQAVAKRIKQVIYG